MVRYLVLLNFTEKGIATVRDSASRAKEFQSAAAKHGVTVEAVYWTLGLYDGALVLNAPDDATAGAAVLQLGQHGSVRTCMLRAFEEKAFKDIVDKLS